MRPARNWRLKTVNTPPFGLMPVTTVLLALVLGSCSKSPTAINSQASVNGLTSVDYSRRIGVAVRTGGRTCMAIKDESLQPDNPVTLILPASPQRFATAQISKTGTENCPITRDVVPGVISYDLSLPQSADFPKLTPLFAVVGSPDSSGFVINNLNVEADLDQMHSKNTFRACGANDGVHLTVWQGVPITGKRLWAGYYYQNRGAPGLPSCTPAETAQNL